MSRKIRLLPGALIWTLFAATACSAGPKEDEKIAPCARTLTRCGDTCVDLDGDEAHCGRCEGACVPGARCEEGVCVLAERPCEEGSIPCGSACVEIAVDPSHCGGCDARCEEGWICEEGECRPPCDGALRPCDGRCVDLALDPGNCGRCGEACEDGRRCEEGGCVCPPETIEAGGHCVPLAAACDRLAIQCEEGERCVEGACLCEEEGWTRCGEVCVQVGADSRHCGGCDQACVAGPREAAICEEGRCALDCDWDTADCDELASNGCEVSTESDPSNCGGCGVDCNAYFNVGGSICAWGGCKIVSCEPGWADCDILPETGCETPIDSIDDCGRCGGSCHNLPHNLAAPACEKGECRLECEEGWDDCDGNSWSGCETSLEDDPANCGACGLRCERLETCEEGRCQQTREWAQWPLPPESPPDHQYEINVDAGTVTDTVTGLEWQRTVPSGSADKKYRPDAIAYCESLVQGGKRGWRLPTAIELLSILDSSANPGPMWNQNTFGVGPNDVFWSATLDGAGNSGIALSFQEGAMTTVSIPHVAAKRFVRCVRAGSSGSGERYEVEDTQAKDRGTGLIWRREATARLSWSDALAHCGTVAPAGSWRLPTKKELESLVDWRLGQPRIDGAVFPNTAKENHLSSTPRAGGLAGGWAVSFSDGQSRPIGPSNIRVRCVREG